MLQASGVIQNDVARFAARRIGSGIREISQRLA